MKCKNCQGKGHTIYIDYNPIYHCGCETFWKVCSKCEGSGQEDIVLSFFDHIDEPDMKSGK